MRIGECGWKIIQWLIISWIRVLWRSYIISIFGHHLCTLLVLRLAEHRARIRTVKNAKF